MRAQFKNIDLKIPINLEYIIIKIQDERIKSVECGQRLFNKQLRFTQETKLNKQLKTERPNKHGNNNTKIKRRKQRVS